MRHIEKEGYGETTREGEGYRGSLRKMSDCEILTYFGNFSFSHKITLVINARQLIFN